MAPPKRNRAAESADTSSERRDVAIGAPPTGTALVNYSAMLAELAAQGAANERPAGAFFHLASGILEFDGVPLPGNHAPVIVLSAMAENVYYEGKYDPRNPTPPRCYAFAGDGRPEEMAPFRGVEDPMSTTCGECPMNEWGSSETGDGKACRNTRRLAVIQAGTLVQDARGWEHEPPADKREIENATIAYLKLPVTSVKAFGSWVHKLASVYRKPTLAFYARLHVVPDAATQFKVVLGDIGEIPVAFIEAVIAKAREAKPGLMSPYPRYEAPSAKRQSAPPPPAAPQSSAQRRSPRF